MLVCSKYRKSLENFGKMLIVLSESGMLMGCWGRRDVVAVLFFPFAAGLLFEVCTCL